MPKVKRSRDAADCSIDVNYAKRQGKGRLLEVTAWPREAPEVYHLVNSGEDRYVVSWGTPELTLHLPRDVFQALTSAALVAPAIDVDNPDSLRGALFDS